MKVFVTGHLGYIGVHLVELLKAAGHSVTGCDIGLFEDCAWADYEHPQAELRKDFREVTVEELRGHDCVMHLAALSNDPMGDVDPELTYSVNREGSIRLAELSKKAGVPRFLFSGSCSVYGKGQKLDLSEDDGLAPLTAYARSKIDSEAAISEMADGSFSPAFLRNATAYGDSPMLRIDIVVNNLLACALATGEIRIMSDGTPWRPLIHCRDIARAFVAFMNSPREAIHNKALNVGGNDENYQVKDVADQVQVLLPDARISYTGEVGNDPRSYRVVFDRLNTLIPAFALEYDVPKGMAELHGSMARFGFGPEHFEGDRFVRLRILKDRLDRLA